MAGLARLAIWRRRKMVHCGIPHSPASGELRTTQARKYKYSKVAPSGVVSATIVWNLWNHCGSHSCTRRSY
ncbi:putative endonuclease [Klebsiella phage vB_KpnP_PRA33]|uniref:Putative endonuclease n=1 Tax=Klebsiella phage vB_KpnP_PRA33 TaxID=1907781 RepID=A0A2H4ZCQ6_9CAUD|nr:endonuclease [Klebsiella phage vB_KpnP_PRA33]AUF73705.1 putative endonuclease [Klebsiella phage vB_KpnP_PRA33]